MLEPLPHFHEEDHNASERCEKYYQLDKSIAFQLANRPIQPLPKGRGAWQGATRRLVAKKSCHHSL